MAEYIPAESTHTERKHLLHKTPQEERNGLFVKEPTNSFWVENKLTKSKSTGKDNPSNKSSMLESSKMVVTRQKTENKQVFVRKTIGYRCRTCKTTFKSIYKYRLHFTAVHKKASMKDKSKSDNLSDTDANVKKTGNAENLEGNLKCRKCGEIFKDNSDKINHSVSGNCKGSINVCHICGKSFKSATGYQYHIRHVHLGIKEHKCPVCDRSFSQKSFITDHMRTHTGERPYVCETCGSAFKTSAAFSTHKRIHLNDYRFHCNMCSFRTMDITHLKKHFTVHTGEKNFACNICDKRFSAKTTLNDHIMTHGDGFPFRCDICNDAFKVKRYLQRHLKSKHRS